MKVKYHRRKLKKGKWIKGKSRKNKLPFYQLTARAIILRRSDKHIFAVRHLNREYFSLPGGGLEDGESAEQALTRELKEENITLTKLDPDWSQKIGVDYYAGYRQLAVWFVCMVDDVDVKPSDEIEESRWAALDEDIWYPHLHKHILLTLLRCVPDDTPITFDLHSSS